MNLSPLFLYWPKEDIAGYLVDVLNHLSSINEATDKEQENAKDLVGKVNKYFSEKLKRLPTTYEHKLINNFFSRPDDYRASLLFMKKLIARQSVDIPTTKEWLSQALNNNAQATNFLDRYFTSLINIIDVSKSIDRRVLVALILLADQVPSITSKNIADLILKNPEIKSDLLEGLKIFIVQNKDVDDKLKNKYLTQQRPRKNPVNETLLVKILAHNTSYSPTKFILETDSIKKLRELTSQKINSPQKNNTSIQDLRDLLQNNETKALFEEIKLITSKNIYCNISQQDTDKKITIKPKELKYLITYASNNEQQYLLAVLLPLLHLEQSSSPQKQTEISEMVKLGYKELVLGVLERFAKPTELSANQQKAAVLNKFLIEPTAETDNVAVLIINKHRHLTTESFFHTKDKKFRGTASQQKIAQWKGELQKTSENTSKKKI